jgi:predicted O-methyltransferase YrrM
MAEASRPGPEMMRPSDEPSVVWSSDHGFTVGDTCYSNAEFGRRPSGLRLGPNGRSPLIIHKSREQVEAFVDLITPFTGSRIVELGIKAGGSTALLAQLVRPAKLVAVDIRSEAPRNLERFLDAHALRDRVRPYYGVDQADGRRLAGIVTKGFEGEAIDLVIDDASHHLEPTTASFEALFPLLRNDGLFVIEDWCWEHTAAKFVMDRMAGSPARRVPKADLLQVLEAIGVSHEALAPLRSGAFLSDLVSQTIVRKADGDATIGDVTLRPFTAEIRRGPGANGEAGLAAALTRHTPSRALHVGRIDVRLASQIASTGVQQLVVVSDEPPDDHGEDWPETVHVRGEPVPDRSWTTIRALGREPFDLVIDSVSTDPELARELATVLLPRVGPGGAYIQRGWRRLVAPQSGEESDPPRRRMPLLLLELMLVVAEWNDAIEDIQFAEQWLIVRRGKNDLSPDDFDVSHLYRDYFESLSRTDTDDTSSRVEANVLDPLADADRLAGAGLGHEAIGRLTAANRARPDPVLEERLVTLRHEVWATLPRRPPNEPPVEVAAQEPSGPLTPMNPGDLAGDTLQRGLAQHGCVHVRGLIAPGRAQALARGIDRALDAFDESAAEPGRRSASPWYVPFSPQAGEYRVGGRRRWVRASGALWTADSPRMLFELLEVVHETGIGSLVETYFGERPALSANKCTLRRVAADASTNWHQDGAFLGRHVRTLNLWLALSPCGTDAPGLDIVPRRFDEILATGTDGALFDWSVSPAQVEEAAGGPGAILRPEFAPGDALLFDHLFLHRTGVTPGMTRQRWAMETWFFAPSTYPGGQIPLAY